MIGHLLKTLTVLLVISGCQSPPVSTDYDEWIQPTTAEGQQCVQRCGSAQWRCDTRVAETLQQCLSRSRFEQRQCETNAYVFVQDSIPALQVLHGEAWRDEADRQLERLQAGCSPLACYTTNRCETQYQQCFFDCGGAIGMPTSPFDHS